jgi:hypothetical protein
MSIFIEEEFHEKIYELSGDFKILEQNVIRYL